MITKKVAIKIIYKTSISPLFVHGSEYQKNEIHYYSIIFKKSENLKYMEQKFNIYTIKKVQVLMVKINISFFLYIICSFV